MESFKGEAESGMTHGEVIDALVEDFRKNTLDQLKQFLQDGEDEYVGIGPGHVNASPAQTTEAINIVIAEKEAEKESQE
jgi:hypothetical protein